MLKKPSSKRSIKRVREIEPFDKRSIDFTKLTPDLSAEDFKKGPPIFLIPIDTLSPTKTLGLGRTNVTIIAPTIVQIDARTPYAGFDRQAQSREPVIQIHFEPGAYPIGQPVVTYVMLFTIEVIGEAVFTLDGFAGVGGTILNAGTHKLTGLTSVSLGFQNLATPHVYGFLRQQSGGMWNWYSSLIGFPRFTL